MGHRTKCITMIEWKVALLLCVSVSYVRHYERQIKTKHLHRLTLGLILENVEASIVHGGSVSFSVSGVSLQTS